MNTPKPIELISQDAAYALRMAIVTRESWLKTLYHAEPAILAMELANLANLTRELGIIEL